MSITRPSFLLLAAAALMAGCSSTEPSPVPSAIAASTSTTPGGVVGTAVAPSPSVTVTSSKGGPMAGVEVTFAVTGGGSVTGATVETNAQGVATVGSWTLGTTAGSYTMTATVGTLSAVTFTATATPGAPASVTIASGSGQSSGVATQVPVPIVVQVKDQYGNTVPNQSVSFAVTAGGGTIGASASTNAEGKATLPAWTLGSTVGTNTVLVTAGSATLSLSATGTPGAATALAAGEGDGQSGDIGVPLAAPMSARVVDQYGNTVSATGVAVSFAVTGGAGTVGSSNTTTSAGVASTTLTLSVPGVTTVLASSPGLTAVTLTANTGPTITGTVSTAVAGFMPSENRSSVMARRAGSPAATTLADRAALPSVEGTGRLTAEQSARQVDTRGRIIVTFKPGAIGLTSNVAAYRSNRQLNVEAVETYRNALEEHVTRAELRSEPDVLPPIAAARIVLADPADNDRVMAELRRDPRIATVEQEGISYSLSLGEHPVPMSELFAAGWSVGSMRAAPATERYGDDPQLRFQLWHYRMVDAFRVWRVTTGSASVRVGVIDTGIRFDHPQLAGVISATEGYDFVDGVSSIGTQTLCGGGTFSTRRGPAPYAGVARTGQDPMQYYQASSGSCWSVDNIGSHGTHVAGTIASTGNDGIGGAGMNWSATIIPIRALGVTGGGPDFDVVQAMLYAGGFPATYTGAAGGFTVQIPPIPIVNMSIGSTTFSTAKALALTAMSGTTLVVASAGNDAWSLPNYPAAYPEALGVSAVGPTGTLASYSNFGSYVGISAPGGNFGTSNSSGVVSSVWNYITMTPTYAYYQGTSMAAPHVTGVAALIKAQNPSFTPAQIRQRLIGGAVDRGVPGRDDIYGAGLLNAYRSVTGTNGPAAVTSVRLVDNAGAVVRTATPAGDGSFTFTRLPAGDYQVVASQDEGGDGLFGIPGRLIGGATVLGISGTTVRNTTVTLNGLNEAEPNGAIEVAQRLVVNSWVKGSLSTGDIDLYVVQIPTAGTYTFETSGVYGACGLTIDARTSLRLLSATGTVVGTNTTTAYPGASYPGVDCSLISMALTPGQYYVEVTPVTVNGSYRLHIRSGN